MISEPSSAKPELEGDIEEVGGKNDSVNIDSLRDKLKKPGKASKRAHEEGKITMYLECLAKNTVFLAFPL